MSVLDSPCPIQPLETAESYILGHLAPAEAAAFEEHYIACPSCAATVEETARYISAMKQAANQHWRGSPENREPGD